MLFYVWSDVSNSSTVLHTQCTNVHGFAAYPDTAVTKNAARTIEENHRRPLLLVLMVLGLHEFRLGGAIGKCHILEFALAAGVANRTIQRMISEQHLDHRLARLPDFFVVRNYDHAFADHGSAGSLKLRHLLDLHQAHAASALQ